MRIYTLYKICVVYIYNVYSIYSISMYCIHIVYHYTHIPAEFTSRMHNDTFPIRYMGLTF